MKKKPLVSIIITYYKKIHFIEKTLKSILNQSHNNYELIFVYDDDSKLDLKKIKKFLKKFKKKKLIINKKNLGVAKSRNNAITHAMGDYIAFLDSDDIWKKDKLKTQLNFMIKNLVEFSFTSYGIIDEEDKLLITRRVKKNAYYNDLIKTNIIGLSTVIVNKNLLSKLRFPNLKTQEDYALWLNLLRQGVKLNHFNKVLSYWRKTNNSLSSNTVNKIFDAFRLFYKYEKKNLLSSITSVIILSLNKILKNF